MINEKCNCYIFGAGEYFGDPPSIGRADFVIAADGGYEYLLATGIRVDLLAGDFDSLSIQPSNVAHDANVAATAHANENENDATDTTTISNLQTLVLPREKDDTDMVAAIRAGRERGFRIFHIYGGTGGRLDHTLANIQCLADLASSGARGYLYGDGVVITAIAGGTELFEESAHGTMALNETARSTLALDETVCGTESFEGTSHGTMSIGKTSQGALAFDETARGTISVFAHSETAHGVCLTGLKYPLTDATISNTYPIGVSNEFTGAPARISVREGTLIVIFLQGARVLSE